MNIERCLNFAGVKSNKINLFRYMIFLVGAGCHLSSGLHGVYISCDAVFKWRLGFVENSYGTFIRKLTTFLSCRKKMNVQGYWGWQEVVGVLSFVAVLALLAS